VIVSLNLPAVSGAFTYQAPASGPDWKTLSSSPWQTRKQAPYLLPNLTPSLPASPNEPWQPGELTAGNDVPLAPPDGISPSGPFIPGMSIPTGTCAIAGEVSDTASLGSVAGAYVDVLGTGRTAQTDSNGKFRIEGLPPGTYTIEASKLGYIAETSSTTVADGQVAEVRLGLRAKPADDTNTEYSLEEETIVGEYQGDGAASLQLDLMAAPSIASGISKDDFTRSGISDAGDAVAKISGANIVGGKYAVVRGLGDRYSNTLVNGALISSADPTKKAVQLDLFPSDLLQSISIYKTFNPELPAEFAGGTVLIKTLQFPDKPLVEFEYGRKWNSSLDGDFYGSGQDLGYFGHTDNDLPSIIPDLEDGGLIPGVTSGRPPSATNPTAQTAIAQANALHLSSPLRPEKRDAEIPESFSLTLGKTFDLGNNLELGVVLAGTSSNGDEAIRDITFGRSLNPGLDGISGSPDDSLNRTQDENRFTSYAGYGLLGSVGLRAGDRHEISFTAFRNHRAEDEVIQARRIRDENSSFGNYAGPGTGTSTPFGATAATFQALDSITPLRRTLDLLQATGHHEVGDEDHPIELDWQYSRSNALEERPGTRTTYFSQLDFSDPSIQNIPGAVYNPSLGQVYTLWDVFGLNPAASETFRETLKTSEESANSRIDLTVPIWHDDDDWFKLKAGGNHFDRSREVRGRLFTYTIGQGLNGQLGSVNGGQYGIDFLNWLNGITGPNGLPIFNGHANGNTSNGIFIDEDTASGNTVRNVDAGTTVTAAYLQADLRVGDWSVIGGARYESEDRTFEVLERLNPPGTTIPFTSIKNDYLLPGININRTFGNDDQVTTTFAWSRTVARPTFFEFAPIRTVDQASGDTFQGNPNLTDTLIDNFDLRWQWSPERSSLFAVSLFHKQLDSPIAQAYSLGDRTFINGDTGSLQGIEVELQKRFLEHWSITSNFTFIDSQLEFQQQTIFGSQTVSTTFDGQPDYIFNLIFGWDHEDLGLSATLNYNFTGSYLTSVPLGAAEPPVRRDDYHQLDLVIQKRFEMHHGVGIVKLNFGNLLDSTDTQTFDGTDLIYSSFRRGRTYGLEFEYRF